MEKPLRRPNILLVIADDHRADAIGAFGRYPALTPTLDQLAREGTSFARAGIMGSLMPAVCAPSRACVLTGLNPIAADAHPVLAEGPEFQVTLPAGAATLPECFRAAGYETFVSGKWHNDLSALLRSFTRGEAIFHGGMCAHDGVPVRNLEEIRRGEAARVADGFSSELFLGAAETFVRERDSARPFFAWVGLTSPHDPRTPPAEFRTLYDPARLPLPENFLPDHPFDNGELDVRDERLVARPVSPAALREELADYYGMISHHDACLGRVVAALRETGELENTIIIYLSDHGLALGSHGLIGKQNLYEHSIRVPLILRGPGIPAGRRSEALCYSLDLYATVCDLAGIAAPTGLDSRSLVPAFADDSRGRAELVSLYMDVQRAVTDGRWKLIVYRVNGRERRQLFDLDADPAELHDLADRPGHTGLVASLSRRLAAWQRSAGDRWWPEVDAQPMAMGAED